MLELAACEPVHQEVRVIEAPERSGIEELLETLLAPLQPLREQVTATTGIGLDEEDEEALEGVLRASVDVPELGVSLSYLAGGDPAGQRIVFVHGSPGTATEWVRFLADVPDGQYRIAVDRIGYGESHPENASTDLKLQAMALGSLLAAEDGRRSVLIGYSYGGPVVLQTALEMPERVAGLLLIAAAADPELEEVHPLQNLAAMEPFAQLLPRELENANAELMELRGHLDAMKDGLARLDGPVSIVHGLRDTLVPPENVVYLQRHLSAAAPMRIFLVEDGDHFLLWSHKDILDQALICLLEDIG